MFRALNCVCSGWLAVLAVGMASAGEPGPSAFLNRAGHPPLKVFLSPGAGSANSITEVRVPGGIGKVPGQLTWHALGIERNLDGATDLWDWRELVENGNFEAARQTVSISVLDAEGFELRRVRYLHAWPSSIEFRADGTNGPRELVHLVHDGEAYAADNPMVHLTAPTNGTQVWSSGVVHVAAAARLTNRIQRVDFFAGFDLVGSVTNQVVGGFALRWTNPPAGFHTISAVAVDLDGEAFSSTNSSSLQVIQGLSFSAWRIDAGFFTIGELANPQVSGPMADPDDDGVPNLFEYAAHTNPRSVDPELTLPRVERRAGGLFLVYRRPAGGIVESNASYRFADVRFEIEHSVDLSLWSNNSAPLGGPLISSTPGEFSETVEVPLVPAPLETSGGFYRVRIHLLNE